MSESEVDSTALEGAWLAGDAVDTTTGEVLLEANSELAADKLSKILDSGVVELNLFFPDGTEFGPSLSKPLKLTSVIRRQEPLTEFNAKFRQVNRRTLITPRRR